MIKILETPKEFMNTGMISNYPPHQKTTNIEAKFYEYIIHNEVVSSKFEYIPIQWTNYLVQNNKDGSDNLQKFLDKKLENDQMYFTVVQYDGGPIVDLKNCIIFSCGGMFDTKLENNTSFLPIPLLSDPHKKSKEVKKKYKASFLGRDTHPIRSELLSKVKNNDDIYIEILEKMSISKKNEKRFKKIMASSFFSLCPRGYGPASYRFYESFSLGTVPIYISDEFHLPYRDIIDWDKLCLLINPDEIFSIPKKIDKILSSNLYDEMVTYGQYCANKYFNYDFTISYIVNTIIEPK